MYYQFKLNQTTMPKKETQIEKTEVVETQPTVTEIAINTPIKEKLGLVETISIIADRMEAVKKNGYNSFHKYPYAKASDIIAAVNKARRGIPFLVVPLGFEETRVEERVSKNGSKSFISFGVMSFKLMAANGEVEIAKVPCSGEDTGDKIPYKAMTGALKYLYTTLFNISDVDLDDVENETAPTQSVAKKQAYTNGSNYAQPKAAQIEYISKTQINELMVLANSIPEEKRDEDFNNLYPKIKEGMIPTSKFMNARDYLDKLYQKQIEYINNPQQNELLELASKVPTENQDEGFKATYAKIEASQITSAKFENAKVYLQLQAKKKAEAQPVNQ